MVGAGLGEVQGGRQLSALAVSGSDLYVGGYFYVGGRDTAIAKWNGSTWSTLGSGVGDLGRVYALAVSGSNLYVGGRFATAGGTGANNIAKWDGTTWSALGSGVDSEVSALAVRVATCMREAISRQRAERSLPTSPGQS